VLVQLLRARLRPYTPAIGWVVFFQLIQTVATLYLPTLNADIIDKGVITGDTHYILRVGAAMLGISLIQIVALGVAVFFGARTAASLGRDVRAGLFHRVQSFSAREIGHFGTPSLITRTTNDVQQVQMLVLMTLTFMVSAPIMCVGGIILALRLDVPLSGTVAIAVPVLGIAVTLIIARMRPLFRLTQVRLDRINQVLREQIAGIRVIRAFVRDDRERVRFERASTELYDVQLSIGRLLALMFPTVMLVLNLSSIAVLWWGGHRIEAGNLEVGELTAFLSYLMQILLSVMMATFMFMMVPRAEVSAERIEEVLGTDTSVVPPSNPRSTGQLHGRLELRDVAFRYPGAERPVVEGLNLSALPGQTTAIIGSTGSGKTTLLNLVPRLFDATEGEVLVDGVSVRDLDPVRLSEAVALVPQKPYLFTGTVASNMRYGRPDASDEELWHALEIAQAKDFVSKMPDGLETAISQGGTNVSGGQRQRLSIARALVRQPEIYLFDDSFSALDYATDAALRAALKNETQGATVVIVAQRVSTIRTADQIIVLEAGRIVATGKHRDLMARNETYREIVLSQLTEQEAVA
jgi:ATP-binding cassette subfamily B multidrug efflux pump